MKRPFLITIKGSVEHGEIIDAHVFATNKESLFHHLQTTIMCNRELEIFDIEKNAHYSKEEFLFAVTKSKLSVEAFERSEAEVIDLNYTWVNCRYDKKRLIKEFKRRTKNN